MNRGRVKSAPRRDYRRRHRGESRGSRGNGGISVILAQRFLKHKTEKIEKNKLPNYQEFLQANDQVATFQLRQQVAVHLPLRRDNMFAQLKDAASVVAGELNSKTINLQTAPPEIKVVIKIEGNTVETSVPAESHVVQAKRSFGLGPEISLFMDSRTPVLSPEKLQSLVKAGAKSINLEGEVVYPTLSLDTNIVSRMIRGAEYQGIKDRDSQSLFVHQTVMNELPNCQKLLEELGIQYLEVPRKQWQRLQAIKDRIVQKLGTFGDPSFESDTMVVLEAQFFHLDLLSANHLVVQHSEKIKELLLEHGMRNNIIAAQMIVPCEVDSEDPKISKIMKQLGVYNSLAE